MDEMNLSENTQEVAELENTAEVENTEVETVDNTTESNEQVQQSAEENARYAAARRRAEQEFAERQRAQDEEVVSYFGTYSNPKTGQPIRNFRDYMDAIKAQNDLQERREIEQGIRNGNLDVNSIDSYIEKQVANNPLILQAQEVLKQQANTQFANQLTEDLKAIQKLDSNIKSIDDIFNLENAEQIIGYTKNMSLVDAYKLANFDALMSNKTSATKQAAINSMKGTQHLNSTTGVSTADDGGVDIPASELGAWQRAFPDASMSELKKKYNKTL